MPVTESPYPVLAHFICSVTKTTGMPPQPLASEQEKEFSQNGSSQVTKQLPKGVVLGPDGKPCRSCTSFGAWAQMMKQDTPATTVPQSTPPAGSTSSLDPPADCPPDVEQLGRSSWTLLHTMAAAYPETPSSQQQNETRQFVSLFGKMYPCWVCAGDFQDWMKQGHEPRVSNRAEFGRWMCEAHNAVNVKLGKGAFDCDRWEERWRTGWKNGQCD